MYESYTQCIKKVKNKHKLCQIDLGSSKRVNIRPKKQNKTKQKQKQNKTKQNKNKKKKKQL